MRIECRAACLTSVFALLAVSCAPLGPPPEERHEVGSEILVARDAIPRSFGRLVGVTTTSGYRENFAQLYFEDESTGTIRIVYFHFRDRVLDPRVEVIERSGSDAPRADERSP